MGSDCSKPDEDGPQGNGGRGATGPCRIGGIGQVRPITRKIPQIAVGRSYGHTITVGDAHRTATKTTTAPSIRTSCKFDDKGTEQLNLLLGRVKRMHDLIHGILQYSRAGRIREEVVEVDMAEVVPAVIDLLSPPPNIRVTVDPLPKVQIERTRVSQVMQNLLSNAIKYMDQPQGLVRVGSTEDGGFWKFYVSDNGPGIEEKDWDRVFQLFQTLKPRDESESTGVGLAVVKRAVELYGGKVWMSPKSARAAHSISRCRSQARQRRVPRTERSGARCQRRKMRLGNHANGHKRTGIQPVRRC